MLEKEIFENVTDRWSFVTSTYTFVTTVSDIIFSRPRWLYFGSKNRFWLDENFGQKEIVSKPIIIFAYSSLTEK